MTTTEFEIRRQEPEDAVALHAVYSQPKVIRGTTMLPYPSLHGWKTRGAEEPAHMTRLVACVDDSAVGNIVLSTFASPRRAHAGELAMAVHDAWQGRGCGRALMNAILEVADQWMNLKRLELEVFIDNEAAVRLYQGCGFEVEGTLQDYALREGTYVDVYSMARRR